MEGRRFVRRVGRGLGAFLHDRRGATAVQAIAMLPAILFFLVAGVKLWDTVNIRKSLHHGTYEAVRYLSLYPPQSTLASDWADIATRYVEAELLSSPFVEPPLNQANLVIQVTLVDSNNCGDKFTVDVTYKLFAPVGSRSIGFAGILPNLRLIGLHESIDGEVVCD
jgi:Flp pilus assembly protein TadG